MIKFFFYRVWKLDRLENYLGAMECQGFKLEYMMCNYWFSFRKTVPKNTQYLLSVSFLKDYEMLCDDYELRKNHGANPVPTHCSGGKRIHRISNVSEDVAEYKTNRDRCLRGVLLKSILVILIFLLGAIALSIKTNLSLYSLFIVGFCVYLLLDSIIGYLYLCYVVYKCKVNSTD